MGLYISDAWRAYRKNWKMLVAVSFLVFLVSVISFAVPNTWRWSYSIFSGFVAAFGTIYAYQKILKTYRDWKNTALQALWALLASAIVGIALMLLFLFGILLIILGKTVGILLDVVVLLAITAYAAKFYYINYLAAKGYSLDQILVKSWNARLSVAWSAILGAAIAGLLIMIVSLALATPAILKVITAMRQASSPEMLIPFVLNALFSGTTIISALASIATYVILMPWLWMFPLVSGKDAVGE